MQEELRSILLKVKEVRLVGLLIVILITTFFFAQTFAYYYQQIGVALSAISPLEVIASFLFFVGYLCLRALSWRSLIHFLGGSINKLNSLSVWFFSEATRYIPGNIWSFLSRAYLARQKRVSKNTSLFVLPVEVLTVITITTALSMYAIIKNLEKLPVSFVFYTSLVLPPLTLLGIVILQKTIRRTLSRLINLDLNPTEIIKAIILQFASWSLYGLGTIVLIDMKVENLPLLFSSALLAWLVGYLSLVTPMGLGVRESAFVILTGGTIGTAQAFVVAVVSRIILIVAELAILGYLAIRNKFIES